MIRCALILLSVLMLTACGKKPTTLLPRAVPTGQEQLYPRNYPAEQTPPPVSATTP